MQCSSCSRQIVTTFLREVAGINIAATSIASRPARSIRSFSTGIPHSFQASRRHNDSSLSSSARSKKDDAFIPFDSQAAAPVSASCTEIDLPSPFAIPEPPMPDEERSRIGHLKDPDFEPEIQVQGNDYPGDLGFPTEYMQDTQAHRKSFNPRRKLRSGQKSHDERLSKWRERNGIPEPEESSAEDMEETLLTPAALASPAPSTKKASSKVHTHQDVTPAPRNNQPIHQASRASSHRASKLSKPRTTDSTTDPNAFTPNPKEPWQIQKAALLSKFASTEGHWAPRKRLSPDALEGIRALHSQYPSKFPTPVLAEHFKVSPEAIRRILKGKWRPNAEEEEERRERWDRRGVSIWKGLVEKGVHPPRRWREMGVGVGMEVRRGTREEKAGGRERKRVTFEEGDSLAARIR